MHALQKVKTVEELQTLHDRYVERYNYTRAMNFNRDCTLKYGSYPNAPLAETANILSLSSWDELMLEGKTMHHCVASYHASIASGKIFIYKVLEPQRLTLAIKRYGNNWAIDQVRAVCNGMPTDKALEAIQLWLGDAQNSLGTHLNTTLA